MSKLLSKHKVKIGGGLLVLAILASVVGWGQWWKSRATKAQDKLADMEIVIVGYETKLEEARVKALTPQEVEAEIKVIYIKKGEVSDVTGFIAGQGQVAKCKACLKEQGALRIKATDALKARDRALTGEQIAIRRKRGWKTKAILGTLGGITAGILIDQLIIKK